MINCSKHFYNDTWGFRSLFRFSTVDTTLCVISGGVPYTAGASFNVGASQENSVLGKRMYSSFQAVSLPASDKVME